MSVFYSMGSARETDYSLIDVFILASGTDERDNAMIEILSAKFHQVKTIVLLKSCDYDLDRLSNIFPEAEIIELNVSSDQVSFLTDLQKIESLVFSSNILIDITSIRVPELFLLFKYIKSINKKSKILAAYSIPADYEFNDEPFTSYHSYYGNLKTMDMVGYGGYSEDMSYKQLIIFLGFEGELSAKVNEDIRHTNLKLVNSVPSFYEKYKDICVVNNYDLIVSGQGKISYVPADNPFEVYNFLDEHLNKEETACIAPLSTKPVALGSCLYALDHEDVRVVYPLAEQYSLHRSNRVHSTYIFSLELTS